MRVRAGVVPVLVLLVAACAGDPEPDRGPEAVPTVADPTDVSRCPSVPEGLTTGTLRPGPDVALPMVTAEQGTPTAVVLLHQTDRDGLCGWLPFIAETDLTALAFDMCGWGSADCPEGWNARTSEQVQAAVDTVRSVPGVQRVVVVGSSLGAARTVFAIADGVHADAWVSLSPPVSWDGREPAAEARDISLPGLVMHDPDDGDAEYAAARRVAARSGAEFVRGRGGHGYDMLLRIDGGLTPYGEAVLDYVAGS